MFHSERVKRKFNQTIKKVVEELSRSITVITVETDNECSNCYYDTVTGKSSGVYKPTGPKEFTRGRCPICKGKGLITSEKTECIRAAVYWMGINQSMGKENRNEFYDPGLEGRSIAKLKTKLCNMELIKTCDYLIVDGLKCVLYKPPTMSGLCGKAILMFFVVTVDKLIPDMENIVNGQQN